MAGHRTFTGVMRERAARLPERDALVVVPGHGTDAAPRTLTYGRLDARARRLAAWLTEYGAAGQRVLVAAAAPDLFAVGLLGCLYAGAVAVPVPPPGGARLDGRVAGVVRDARPCLALTCADRAAELSRTLARTGHGSVPCLAVDAVPAGEPVEPREPDPDSVALLQYTSGSTAEPRGVAVSHANLIANQQALQAALGTTRASRPGGWLPPHHDMGLVGQLLHPLWLGATSVVMSPTTFVRRPVAWLETISRYRLTVSAAPDFAYELCARQATDEDLAALDLSCWQSAVSGGEPVRASTLRAFAERFAPAGFRADAFTVGYGLAESTLLVCAGRPAHSAAARRASTPPGGTVSCGQPVGCEVRVVDPETRAVLPDGATGEVWVRGAGVARGYWDRVRESADVFGAVTADGEGGFLRTGDLGLLADGELFVGGRLKDVLVVAGRSLHPHELEHSVRQISALFGPGVAFTLPGQREQVVLVQELRARQARDLDLTDLARRVRRRLDEEFAVTGGGLVLVRPGTVRRTTSGKVRRSATRRLFLRGEIDALYEEIPARAA
ncbi:fatty acyl-AMP ligase [Streptomyces sp. NPDC053367]|uniref:fatty acyl-AMP ligase n=1 Tax=Streptomyces sp. NPDC053367 TaxID=3365700 RepID=UPI0037CE4184